MQAAKAADLAVVPCTEPRKCGVILEQAARASRVAAAEWALAQAVRKNGDDSLEAAHASRQLGLAHLEAREPSKAIVPLERSIAIRRQLLGNTPEVALSLSELATAYGRAQRPHKQLQVAREQVAMVDVPSVGVLFKARAYTVLAHALRDVDDREGAVAAARKAVSLHALAPGPPTQQALLANLVLAATLRRAGDVEAAQESARSVLRHAGESTSGLQLSITAHDILADTSWALSQPEAALFHRREGVRTAELLGQRLVLAREQARLASFLANLLGQTEQGIGVARQVLERTGHREDLGSTEYASAMSSLASIYGHGGEIEEGRRVARMAIEANEAVAAEDSMRVSSVLAHAAWVAARAGEHQEAARMLRRALAIREAAPIPCDFCAVQYLLKLAESEEALGRPAEAGMLVREAFTRSLDPSMNLDSSAGAALALARTQAREGQLAAAIFHGKRALNLRQVMRGRMAALPEEQRRGFVERREASYREVAAWLVEAGRLPEAHQVLDLLKDAELQTLLRTSASSPSRALESTRSELAAGRRLADASGDVVRLAADLAKLRAAAAVDPSQHALLGKVEAELGKARLAFDRFIAELHRDFAKASPERNQEIGSMQLDRLVAMRRTLADLGEGVVMLHYVVAPDRLAIILTTPKVQVARESHVTPAALNRAVFEMRTALQDPARDPRGAARRLHDLAIAPIAADLEQANPRVLMLSLDGALRYVPFAALHDGERFLAERYATALFTAAARDKLKDRPRAAWSMAGMGVTRAHEGFVALPSVRQELESIHKVLFPGEVHLDEAFTAQRLQDSLSRGFPLLHIASHFHFRPGPDTDSFLLLGDGSRLTLRDIRVRNLDLGEVDLVTLSACETAMGGGRDEWGREVEGLGALLQNQGAKSVVATLWPVADDSTSRFMLAFYSARSKGVAATKAEALRTAQVEFIRTQGGKLAHPFHWGAFILMGNWL